MIKLENVTKRFGNMVAVDNVSIDILEGEFFVLLGPSTPSRLLSAFPADVPVARVPLADAASAIRDFLRDCAPHTPPLTQADGTESGLTG